MPGLDITPRAAAGRPLIQAYGGGRFRVAGVHHTGSILIGPRGTLAWSVTRPAEITFDSLESITREDVGDAGAGVDILLIGCGPRFLPPPAGLGEALGRAGMVLEWMDTGAACRTFNVLLLEDRRAAAALIAVE